MVNAQHTPFCKNPLPRASSTALAVEVLKVMLQGPGGLWDHGEEQPVPKALLHWGTGHTELKQEGSFFYCLVFFKLIPYNSIFSPPKQSEIIRIPAIPDGVSGSPGCAETPLSGKWKILPWHCQHIWCCFFFVFQTRKVESISSGRRHAVFINAVTDRGVVILTHQHWLGHLETEMPVSPRLQHPLEIRTEVGSFQHCHCPEQHSDKIQLWEVTF